MTLQDELDKLEKKLGIALRLNNFVWYLNG